MQVAEAARAAGIKRIWYASSACIYPEGKQTDENLGGASGLKEDDAWPAQPQAPPPSPPPSQPPPPRHHRHLHLHLHCHLHLHLHLHLRRPAHRHTLTQLGRLQPGEAEPSLTP